MKILYVTTVGVTMGFFEEHFRMLLSKGHTIELACNTDEGVPSFCREMGLKIHAIPFSRSPLDKSHLAAYKALVRLVRDGGYDIVHTHSPTVSVLARLACRPLRRRGLQVFYTAHGFHFYKGAPLRNWLLYYPVEWLCAHYTDKLLTINGEDYALAQKRMHAREIHYIPGVGISLQRFGGAADRREQTRRELGIPRTATVLLSVGELNRNKNHETVIRAMDGLDVYYLIAGVGDQQETLQGHIDATHGGERVRLLGYCTDVTALYAAADVFVFPSYREGLSVALMEAMASGLPVACSAIRGNTDLMDEQGGELFDPYRVDSAAAAITRLLSRDLRAAGEHNRQKVQAFSNEPVVEQLQKIYHT